MRCIQDLTRNKILASPNGAVSTKSFRGGGREVRITHHSLRLRATRSIALAVLVGAAMLLAGCGSSSSSELERGASGASSATSSSDERSTTSASTGSGSTSSCGPKPGVKATGTPINIGTIDTKQPGTDFSDGPNMIIAYYNCVNANGGVNGHPVKLYVIYDQTQPAQVAGGGEEADPAGPRGRDRRACSTCSSARSTRATGSSSASTRWAPGIAPECWSTPNSAAVNMGPRYSSDGAVQYGLSPAPVEDRVRPVERAGNRLHRGRPRGAGGGPAHRRSRS